MAAIRLMAITMNFLLMVLLLLVPATSGRYLRGRAIETQAGMMPMDGVSPVPTEAPGLNGIPKELRRRVIRNFTDPAPSNWCGIIDDGNYQRIVSCLPNIPCKLKSNFNITCDFNYDLPTTCLDYKTYQRNPWIGDLTAVCANPLTPYCITVTSSGLSPQFGCSTTDFPRIHSFVPIAAYYSSLNATRTRILSNTSGAKTYNTTVPEFRMPVPTSDYYNSYPTGNRKSKLPFYANTGIGSNGGLLMIAVIVVIVIRFWQKRKREHAKTKVTSKGYEWATQPVQQQYQSQPQGCKENFQPVQQYQPQLDNTKFPDSDIPPYSPAQVYTSGSPQISVAPIPFDELTSDTKIGSHCPSSTVKPAPPLSPNPSDQMNQQQQNTAQARDHLPNSHISPLGPVSSDLPHQAIPLSHSEMGVEKSGSALAHGHPLDSL